MFEANTMKCGSRTGEQQVRLRVSSSEHRNLQVSFFRSVCYKNEFRFQLKRNYKFSLKKGEMPTGNKQRLGKAKSQKLLEWSHLRILSAILTHNKQR